MVLGWCRVGGVSVSPISERVAPCRECEPRPRKPSEANLFPTP